MDISRRGFLGAVLLAGAAPAFISAERLMRMVPTATGLLLPEFNLGVGIVWVRARYTEGEVGKAFGVMLSRDGKQWVAQEKVRVIGGEISMKDAQRHFPLSPAPDFLVVRADVSKGRAAKELSVDWAKFNPGWQDA